MAQWVKDPALSLLWLGSLLCCRFNLWPRNFCMPQVQPKIIIMCMDILIKQLFPSGAIFYKDLTRMSITIGIFSFYHVCVFLKKILYYLSHSIIPYFIYLYMYVTVQ